MTEQQQLRIEHYKALKEEYRQYLMQVQQLWTYKLSALGAIIAAAIFNDKIIKINDNQTDIPLLIATIGIISLPVLSFLIDLKVLEVGLHVKLISKHMRKSFSDVPIIQKWEIEVWLSGYSKNRTFLTLFAALGTSLLVLGISIWIMYQINNSWKAYMTWMIIFSLIGIALIGIKVFPKLGLFLGKTTREKYKKAQSEE
ncbi:MAG: hypothetical protein ACJ77K_15490 [Bacteroidia bacterium]